MISLALTRAAEATLPAMPGALDRPVSEIAGTIAYLVAPGARAAVRSNLAVVSPGSGSVRRVFVSQVRHYLETFRLLRLDRERLLAMVDVRGWEHLAAAHGRGKGVILASAHLGPVVVCGQVIAAKGLDVAVLVETKSGEMGRLIDRARAALGVRTIETRSAMAIGRTLLQGGVVGILSDRAITGVGERVTFFGREALMPAGHVALALRTGAALVPAFASREGRRFVAGIGAELVLSRTGDREADLREGMRAWAAVLEQQVSRAPEEWSVFEPFWGRHGPR